MITRLCMLLLVISGCAAVSAPAQGAPPKFEVGPGPYNLDLDAGSGESEERFLQVPGGAFTVKGFIQFTVVRTNPKWEAMAAVEVMGPKESFNAGLLAFVLPNAPDKLQLAVRDVRLAGFDGTFARMQLSYLSIPFELRLNKSGVLQVSVAGKLAREVSVRPIEITRIRVMASTAHVRFSNIELSASDK